MTKTLPAAPHYEEVWFKRGHYVPERHGSQDEDIDFRRWMRQYVGLLERHSTINTGMAEWSLFPQSTPKVAAEHLSRVFALIAGAIEKGLVESLTASTVVLLHRRVRDMDRRLSAVEARLVAAPTQTFVLVDWENVRRSAEEVGTELGWSGTWTANPQENRIELRLASKDIDRVSSSTFKFYQHMAQKLSPEVMQHIRFDYDIVDS